MFVRALNVFFLEGVTIEMIFQDGKIIRYDMSKMFSKYPQLKALKEDRKLFENGYLDPAGYGVIWNEELDFDAMSVYEGGDFVGYVDTNVNYQIGFLLAKLREEMDVTQKELAEKSHIDQGDISKIEKGIGNPTIGKINRLFRALGKRISITLL